METFHALGMVKGAEKPSVESVLNLIDQFKSLFDQEIKKSDIISLINDHLSDFSHIETGKSLDQKM